MDCKNSKSAYKEGCFDYSKHYVTNNDNSVTGNVNDVKTKLKIFWGYEPRP